MQMFAGESFLLVYFYLNMRKNGKKYKAKEDMAKFGGRYRSKVSSFVLSSFLDFLNSCTYIISSIHGGVASSIIRAGRILIVALCMKCFTKIKLKKHHLYGMTFTVTGLCLVDLADIGSEDQTFYTWGFVLIVFSMLLSCIHIIYQQHLLIHYYTEPSRLVGFEGLFGMSYCVLIILIFNYV